MTTRQGRRALRVLKDEREGHGPPFEWCKSLLVNPALQLADNSARTHLSLNKDLEVDLGGARTTFCQQMPAVGLEERVEPLAGTAVRVGAGRHKGRPRTGLELKAQL